MTSEQPARTVVVVTGRATGELPEYAHVLQDLAGLPVRVLRADDADAPQIQAALPADAGALVLAGARPAHARAVQALVGVPVITDQDCMAIALAARLLTTLAGAGRALWSGRVVIAGADTLPILCPLVMAAGIGDITTWSRKDAVAFPLHRIATGADAVIDLLDAWSHDGDATRREPAVITPMRHRDPLFALPGLLRAHRESQRTAGRRRPLRQRARPGDGHRPRRIVAAQAGPRAHRPGRRRRRPRVAPPSTP